MKNGDKTVLVTGATGRQGGAVIRHMLPKGWKLRALTRNPNSHAAKQLAGQGVALVQGDLEDPASLERAARGVYGIYSVQDFWAVGARREVQQGKNLAEIAKKAGVTHFVFSSVGGAERNSGITHWETKWEIEQYIRQLGLPATIFRPAGFMEIYHMLELEVRILKGKFLDPVRPDKTYQSIATDDIGSFVALAFERPKEFIGMELEIAGSELTPPQTADVFSRVMGRPVKYGSLPMLAVRLLLGKEFYEMFRWFNKSGFQANIPELRRQYPEVHLHTLEEWLREDGWDKRGLRFRAPKTN
jgi:uncharacterized protein YbjT (DUF2867 family)